MEHHGINPMRHYLDYEVRPGANVPQGLPRQRLAVLSPVWQGPALRLDYPDGEVHTLVGWSGSGPGGPSEVRVFWTRPEPAAPEVALAIGGDAGVRNFGPGDDLGQGLPFMALAAKLIPAEVLKVIGPPPAPDPKPPLLLG